nr:helicase C-terminal domain-containing protein [Methanocella sp. CWC-04]
MKWEEKGAKTTIAKYLTSNVNILNEDVKKKVAKYVLVLLNAYDGIDLADSKCRVLVLDSLPSYDALIDRYTQYIRPKSKFTKRLLAQRIEQGMGRAIRGPNDWCILIVIGNDITEFFSEKNKIKYLSNEAQKQIEIGEQLISIIKAEGGTLLKIQEIVLQSLNRDPSLKEYYKQQMSQINIKESESNEYLNNALSERDAELHYLNGKIRIAVDIVQNLHDNSDNYDDKGWYLQLKSIYLYESDKTRAMDAQLRAFEKNNNLFRPPSGVKYSKISKGRPRAVNIKEFIKEHDTIISLIINVGNILDQVSFSNNSDNFEEGIKQVGRLLGFESQRPDKESGCGPDNLWQLDLNHYWVIECKNEVDGRDFVSKNEVGQMHNSISWFKVNYEGSNFIPLFIHPATFIDKNTELLDPIYVIDESSIESLKRNISGFYKSLPSLEDKSEKFILERLVEYNLDNNSLNKYFTRLKHKK